MSSITKGAAVLAGALALCGCAVERGVEHQRLATMLDEYEREVEALTEVDEVELIAADSLGRRMDRSHRRLRD